MVENGRMAGSSWTEDRGNFSPVDTRVTCVVFSLILPRCVTVLWFPYTKANFLMFFFF